MNLPERASTAPALRLLGLRAQVHPRDALAYLYGTQAEADDARRTYEEHALPWLGDAPTEMGIVGVIDCRPAMAARRGPVDPAMPDDYVPGEEHPDDRR